MRITGARYPAPPFSPRGFSPKSHPSSLAGNSNGIGDVPRTRIFVPGIVGPQTVTRIVTRVSVSNFRVLSPPLSSSVMHMTQCFPAVKN